MCHWTLTPSLVDNIIDFTTYSHLKLNISLFSVRRLDTEIRLRLQTFTTTLHNKKLNGLHLSLERKITRVYPRGSIPQ